MAKLLTHGLWELTLYCMILDQYPFLGETLQDTYEKVHKSVSKFLFPRPCVFKNLLRDLFFSRLLIAPWSSQMIWTRGWRTCWKDFFVKVSGICSSTFYFYSHTFIGPGFPGIFPHVFDILFWAAVFVQSMAGLSAFEFKYILFCRPKHENDIGDCCKA